MTNKTYTKIAVASLTLAVLPTSVHAEGFFSKLFGGKEKTEEVSAKPYTLKTCLVSDEKLGEMGDTITMIHEGQEWKFCCKPCVKKFNKDPKKYTALLAKATKK